MKIDPELAAIGKIMAILEPMTTLGRTRVLEYVASRCDGMDFGPPGAPNPGRVNGIAGEDEPVQTVPLLPPRLNLS